MTHEALKRKAEEKLPSKLQSAREEYEEEWLQETCEILTDAGEFKSVEQCKKEGVVRECLMGVLYLVEKEGSSGPLLLSMARM